MKKNILFPILTGALLLSACGKAPATDGTVPTGEPTPTVPGITATPVPESSKISLETLAADLNALTKLPSPLGSEGEQNAVEYLQNRLGELGYEVTLQAYENNGATGHNVIAVKKATSPDADIFVISAHHDSVPTAYGANDNASGVTALLSIAEALADLETDTELRFISFTDEENGKNGSRFYTESLTEEERARIIGDIQLDMLGGLGTSDLALFTTDGESNWVTDFLQEKDETLTLDAETASDHTSFQLAGIPAVMLMQNGRGYLYHSIADTADQIDLEQLKEAAELVVSVVTDVASEETASYKELAREQADNYTFCHTPQTVIYFGSSLKDSETYIGAAGTLVESREETYGQWTDVYDTYQYSMRWFNAEKPMNTYYHYRNGFLQNISIQPTETGYTKEEVRELLVALYGEPKRVRSKEDGLEEGWEDVIYSKYITLLTSAEDCKVTVSKYAVGISNVVATYPIENGTIQTEDASHQLVWDYFCSILPEEARGKIAEFNLFTDGSSGILAFTSPLKHEDGTVDNTRFSINIDYYDVFDENGNKKDWSKLTYTILHEYGHALLENETQVDLTLGANTHDPAGYVEGSIRKQFYDRFWKHLEGTGVNDYAENPTNYVSRYGANYFHEDMPDTFAVFVLGGKPEGKTVSEEKILFFWDIAEMVELRSSIRENLGLSE